MADDVGRLRDVARRFSTLSALSRMTRSFRGLSAGFRDNREVFQESFTRGFRESSQDFRLQFQSDGTRHLVNLFPFRQKPDASGAAILAIFRALDPSIALHSLEERGNGIGVARDGFREIALRETAGVHLDQGAHHGELVGRESQMENFAPEGLVQAVPGAAE
jgi:hypothetical protein